MHKLKNVNMFFELFSDDFESFGAGSERGEADLPMVKKNRTAQPFDYAALL